MSVLSELKDLHSDEDKWRYLLTHKDRCKNITIRLDNDQTEIWDDRAPENDELECILFNNHIGNSQGVVILLDAIGIKYERY